MNYAPQIKIPATYMRGGTSKGVFFNVHALPAAFQVPGPDRDAMLLRVIGSPDPYAKQIDGMGGASSSTSKSVLVQKSNRADHDVDYLFGQISIGQPFVDWSGNCGNLSAAVGPFAINEGLIDSARIPHNGTAAIRIWQANIEKTIIAHVPISNGEVQETGGFELDGVTFPAAEVILEFMDPADSGDGAMFPTGELIDTLDVPGLGSLEATLINAGIPTIFLRAEALGLTGLELQDDINNDSGRLAQLEIIRAIGAMKMGLIADLTEAETRQHTPKIAFVTQSSDYIASSGKAVSAEDIDIAVRALSMGKLHHAMMGTAAVAIGAAAAVPGTIVNETAGGGKRAFVRFGHPSGTLRVGAEAAQTASGWIATKASMSRSARVLMEGFVRIPG